MAILRAYGWDCGNIMMNNVDYTDIAVSTTKKKTGVYSLYIAAASYTAERWARFVLDGTPANPSVSVWFYLSQYLWSGASAVVFTFTMDTGKTIELRVDGIAHTFDAYVDGIKAADGTVSMPNYDVWVHLQFYVVIDDAPNGHIYCKIDGHESIAYTGDTKPGAETGATYFRIGCTGGSQAYSAYFDDLVIGSGGYLGDLRCVDIRPTADTAQDDWTPSAGDNFETINETPPSDTDYNETNTNAQADELALGDFDGVTYTPVAVTAWARAEMLAATGDSLKVGIVSNAVEVTTTSALSTTWEYYFHTEDENPDGPVAWDDAAIDALLFRYESVIA